MSVIVIGRMSVDPANVERLFTERKADFESIAQAAKGAGALHHRWGFGKGQVMIVDEWPDEASFHAFFQSQTRIGELMHAAQVQGPPEFEIYDAKDAPDQF
jgi:hypothetical protein